MGHADDVGLGIRWGRHRDRLRQTQRQVKTGVVVDPRWVKADEDRETE